MTGRRGESPIADKGIENGPYSYGRQQSRILRNGRKADEATPREG